MKSISASSSAAPRSCLASVASAVERLAVSCRDCKEFPPNLILKPDLDKLEGYHNERFASPGRCSGEDGEFLVHFGDSEDTDSWEVEFPSADMCTLKIAMIILFFPSL